MKNQKSTDSSRAVPVSNKNIEFQTILNNQQALVTRRYNELGHYYRGKSVLDYNCNTGYFVASIMLNTTIAMGIEKDLSYKPMYGMINPMLPILIYDNLENLKNTKFDLITIFDVKEFELAELFDLLTELKKYLYFNGRIILEVENKDCYLFNNCNAYRNHVKNRAYRLNRDDIYSHVLPEKMTIEKIENIQIHNLAFARKWFDKGLPGGDREPEYNDIWGEQKMTEAYTEALIKTNRNDTLRVFIRNNEEMIGK